MWEINLDFNKLRKRSHTIGTSIMVGPYMIIQIILNRVNCSFDGLRQYMYIGIIDS